MFKVKRIAAAGLAAVMAMSAFGFNVLADDDTDIVYTYTDENQEIVNVTRAELDAGHWNTDALGDVAPYVYEDFPLSVTSFANDCGELSLNLVYMKNISDMSSVKLEIMDMDTETDLYNGSISKTQFYSPVLNQESVYWLSLEETVDGETAQYTRIIVPEETEADLPDYVMNASADDEDIILIADTDTLKAGITTDSDGNTVVNSSVAKYNSVEAKDFSDYCENLTEGKIYRIQTTSAGRQYNAFLTKENGNVRTFGISAGVYTEEFYNSPSTASQPSSSYLTYENVKARATSMGMEDMAGRVTESSETKKFLAYRVELPTADDGTYEDTQYAVDLIANAKSTGRYWMYDEYDNILISGTLKSGTYITTTFNPGEYDSTGIVYLYLAVYATGSSETRIVVNAYPTESGAYEDDVTGSLYEAYSDVYSRTYTLASSRLRTLANTEFYLTDDVDTDAFMINAASSNNTYKITMKNRSLSDQTKLENGTIPTGGTEKYITIAYMSEKYAGNGWSTGSTYTVAANSDITVYCDTSGSDATGFTVKGKSGSSNRLKYQLAFSAYN